MVLRMSVLTHPEVTASFGQESHTVAEGATQSVTVTLSADPERTVTIPIVTMGQDGASSVDYSGVPDSVTFNAGGPTEMTFTFTATQDTVDDEGESVLLGFGPDLSGGVSAGTPDETTLTITDDDPPEVSFGQSAYTVAEGGMVSVEVKLTSALGSAVTVPVTHTPQGATSAADYSGVPANVTFSARGRPRKRSPSVPRRRTRLTTTERASCSPSGPCPPRYRQERRPRRRSTSPTTTRRRSPSARAPTRSPKAAW